MNRFAALSFGAALTVAAFSPMTASAASFGAVAATQNAPAIATDVQFRRGYRGGRHYGHRGHRGGALAAGAIGAAILGGALIANSNRRYYDDGFYGYDEPSPVYDTPYYGEPDVYYAPRAYGPRQRVRPGTQRDPARGGLNR